MERLFKHLLRPILPRVLEWLESRALYIPEKDIERIARAAGVDPQFVRAIERLVVRRVLDEVERAIKG